MKLDAHPQQGRILLTECDASIDDANLSGRWIRGDVVEVRQ